MPKNISIVLILLLRDPLGVLLSVWLYSEQPLIK